MSKISGEWLGFFKPNEGCDERKYGGFAPYFRKRFDLDGGVKKAELKIAALGWFKAYLNGEEITKDEELLASWTDYNKRIEYITYDVTAQVKEENAIGVCLGYGWACGSAAWHKAREHYGVFRPCFVAELLIAYEDGRTEFIQTDASWKATVGEIERNDLMAGEYIDARKSLGNFSAVSYDDSAWSTPEIRESRSHLLVEEQGGRTRVQERVPLTYMHAVGGADIYTTGQNLAGFLTCKIVGERGAKVVFRHGEKLAKDRSLYTENLRSAEATDTYICSGEGVEIFRPKFTFHGFEFVEVTIEGQASISDLTALVLHSDLRRTGEFRCSNELLNKIYRNTWWGQRSNFINVPTDCPQRDERLGWTGDIQVFCGTAAFNSDVRAFLKKYLRDLADAQTEEGGIPPVAPWAKTVCENAFSATGWGDAMVILPYYYWRFYGDTALVEEYMPAMKKYIRHVESISSDYKRNTYCYGDWLAFEETEGEVIDTAFAAYLYRLMRRMCAAIEDPDALVYGKKQEKARARFLEKYVDNTGKISADTQTAYLLACQFRILSKEEVRPHLIRKIKENDGKLSCGFLGVKFLLPILCEIGEPELAYRLICDDRCPSWGYSVKNGATTMWERWDSYTEENGFQSTGMNSFNHYAYGSCVEWYYKYILGINPGESGFEKLKFCPYIDTSGKVHFAEGSYDSVKGKIGVKWRVETGGATCTLTLPKGMKYEAEFPTMRLISTKKKGEEIVFTLKKF